MIRSTRRLFAPANSAALAIGGQASEGEERQSGKNGLMREELRSRLAALGASDDDMDRAEAQGWLPLLAFERTLLPGVRKYDLDALVAAAGIDEALARGLWRA